MAEVRIVTDVTALLQPEVISRHRITVTSLEVTFGDEQFVLDPARRPRLLLERMRAGPAESARITARAEPFEAAYRRLSRETDEILVILSSGKLSNGVAQAQAASRMFLGQCRIMVIDSMITSWGLGLVVEAAARAAARGESLDGIVRLIRGMLPHIYVLFFVERLDYLEQRGRISPAQAWLGSLLRIKPMLLLEDGVIIPLEKVRTLPMAVDKLVDFVSEFATIDQMVIARSPVSEGEDERIGHLAAELSEVLPGRDFPVVEYDPVLACHVGPEALGVMVYEGD